MKMHDDLDVIIEIFSRYRCADRDDIQREILRLSKLISDYDRHSITGNAIQEIEVIYRFCQGISYSDAPLNEYASGGDYGLHVGMLTSKVDSREFSLGGVLASESPQSSPEKVPAHIEKIWKLIAPHLIEEIFLDNFYLWSSFIPNSYNELKRGLSYKFREVPDHIVFYSARYPLEKAYMRSVQARDYLVARHRMRLACAKNALSLKTLQSMNSDRTFVAFLYQFALDAAPNRSAVLDTLVDHLRQ